MEELVQKAKSGDKEAYTDLILLIKNDLYKICKARVYNDDEINDIVQETMIQTFKNIKKLKDNSKFKQWVIKILINNCNKFYKKKQKLKFVNFEEEYNRNLENAIDKIESDMNFYTLLKHLKYEERIIVILYYAEGFKLKEIGKILHMNENTVKTKLFRVKEKLKKEYEGGMKIG